MFKALADPTRRELLDELFRRDGQTLTELESRFDMTRFGVMKHLRVLTDAGLVATRKRGREKLHFLNPVPIRLVHDRWVSKYAEPWAASLSDLKDRLEQEESTMAEHPTDTRIFEIYIRTTPERLWQAITDPDERAKFQFGNRVSSDWSAGSRYEVTNPKAPMALMDGTNLEVDPPRRLVQDATCHWSPEVEGVGATRITWEIEPVGDSCHLRVTHDRIPEGTSEEVYGGWPMILSGLKTWIETGETLTTPGSLLYG